MTFLPHDQLISIVMPVHNAMPYLDDAVRSILEQTYTDFEFVILDDGSTDGSTERLRQWARRDSRIRLIESKANLGPVGSSNRVVELACAQLIARMDADDISHPTRIERQVQILRERTAVGLVACVCDVIGSKGETIRGPDVWRPVSKSWFAPFAHGSALFRRDLFEGVGGYRKDCEFWEDQDLFARMLAFSGCRIVTIRDTLYRVRYSRVSTRVASDQRRVEAAVDLMYRSVDRLHEGKWYDDLLLTPPLSGRLDPRVFIAIGSLDLWANGKPRLFRRLLKDGRLGWNFRTVSALVWTAWASLSPSSLRLFMKALVGMRNLLASGSPTATIEWSPRGILKLRRGSMRDRPIFTVDRRTDHLH